MGELIMYIVVRRDLLTKLKWPLGAIVAQCCHASTAVLWKYRDSTLVEAYLADTDRMRKCVLQVADEHELRALSKKLKDNGIDHYLWTEQPENIITCMALKPCLKDSLNDLLKHLKLFA